MLIRTGLPKYDLAGLLVRPGDIIGRTKFGSIIEHTFLLGFDDEMAHSSGPGDVFRSGHLYEVLKDGGVLRVVDPTNSLRETELRFAHANRIVGVQWWSMNCHQTTDYIVQASRHPWLM
jgi:hypothetical protein